MTSVQPVPVSQVWIAVSADWMCLGEQTKTQYNISLCIQTSGLAGTELYNANQSLYRTNELTRSCSYRWRLNPLLKNGAVLQDTVVKVALRRLFSKPELLFVEDSP